MATRIRTRPSRPSRSESAPSRQSPDVRLTPATADGIAWTAQLLSPRAKTLFNADEVVVAGTLVPWLMKEAARADLRID